jgi:zona occludens toxin
MSITAYTGLPGSGKSYGVVENAIIPALKAGRHVWHNMTLHEDSIRGIVKGGRLSQVPDGAKAEDVAAAAPPGAVIVLDEVWKYWPAGLKTDDLSETQRSFFAEHRHRVDEDGNSTEIVLIVQDLGTGACRFVRELVETTYRAAKLSAVGLKSRYRIDVYQGAATGQRPPEHSKLRSIHGTYKKEVYACYLSHTKSITGTAGNETSPDDRANALKSGTVKAAVLAVVAFPFILWLAVSQFLSMGQHQKKPAATERSEVAPVPPSVVPSLPPALVDPAAEARERARSVQDTYSPTWRLSGVVVKVNGKGRALLVSATGRRVVSVRNCKADEVQEWACDVDGYTVAQWTGGQGQFGSAAVAPGSFRTASEVDSKSPTHPDYIEAPTPQASTREVSASDRRTTSDTWTGAPVYGVR